MCVGVTVVVVLGGGGSTYIHVQYAVLDNSRDKGTSYNLFSYFLIPGLSAGHGKDIESHRGYRAMIT